MLWYAILLAVVLAPLTILKFTSRIKAALIKKEINVSKNLPYVI